MRDWVRRGGEPGRKSPLDHWRCTSAALSLLACDRVRGRGCTTGCTCCGCGRSTESPHRGTTLSRVCVFNLVPYSHHTHHAYAVHLHDQRLPIALGLAWPGLRLAVAPDEEVSLSGCAPVARPIRLPCRQGCRVRAGSRSWHCIKTLDRHSPTPAHPSRPPPRRRGASSRKRC